LADDQPKRQIGQHRAGRGWNRGRQCDHPGKERDEQPDALDKERQRNLGKKGQRERSDKYNASIYQQAVRKADRQQHQQGRQDFQARVQSLEQTRLPGGALGKQRIAPGYG